MVRLQNEEKLRRFQNLQINVNNMEDIITIIIIAIANEFFDWHRSETCEERI
uniref:Uncharacterized protein n=1 Tax=Octopus bimaculoides TaxID=37653 RepID=A0A0L8HW89_OCTBM